MKQLISFTTAILCVITLNASAQQPEREPGFSGNVMFGAFYLSAADNLIVTDEDAIIDNLNDSPETDSLGVPAVFGEVNYTFESRDSQVFAGLNRIKATRGDFAPEIGYRYFYGDRSKLEVAYLPGIAGSDTWKDPFITNAERSTTSRTTTALRFRAENLIGPVSFEIAQGERKIDDDESGQSLSLSIGEAAQLWRDADLTYLGVDTSFHPTPQLTIIPGIYLFEEDAIGNANDFELTGGEIAMVYGTQSYLLMASFGYEQLEFDTVDPVFNEIRDEDAMTFFGLYQYNNPFGYEDTKLMMIVSNRIQDSNIAFYESDSVVVGGGIVFSF